MYLNKLQEIVRDRGAWYAAVHGSQRAGHDLAAEEQQQVRLAQQRRFVPIEVLRSQQNMSFPKISMYMTNY